MKRYKNNTVNRQIVLLKKENKQLHEDIENLKKYSDYLKDNLERNIKYSEYLANNIGDVHKYLMLKYNDEFTMFRDMKDSGKSDDEIKLIVFRKNKIKKILDE